MPRRLLIIEDDPAFSRRLQANLRADGFTVEAAGTGAEALEDLKNNYYDLVVSDIRLPDINGLEILERIKQGRDGLDPAQPVLMLTSVRDMETAVRSMRAGASDYLTKECERQEVLMRIERVLEQSALQNENRYLRDQLDRQDQFREMVGDSPAMRVIKDDIAMLAGQDVPVLITGETGAGKELVARALHRTGANPKGPFVDVNCGALPDENLLLSELFGHERGAFTGATGVRRGKFELARGGTLFLDEIGEMPLEAQAKILKTIETFQVTRLGGTHPIEAACRLIFATNRNLEKEVREGRFRQDLYYRINLMPLALPALRERREDIPQLAVFFLDQFCAQYRKPPRQLDADAQACLQSYNWPGNVRELRNVIERLVIRSRAETITQDDIERCGVLLSGGATAVSNPVAGSAISLFELPEEWIALEEVERNLVVTALERSEWNQKKAAALLRISVDRMNARVKKFGLTHPSWRVNR
jgi:DNA-binding NtrC family response regulator